MTKHSNKVVATLRKCDNAQLFLLDNGGLRLMLSPPLTGLEIPPGHVRIDELLALVAIDDDQKFEDAAKAAVDI